MRLVKIGTVKISPDGKRWFSNWWWEDDGTGPIDLDDLVEIAKENGTFTDYRSSEQKVRNEK